MPNSGAVQWPAFCSRHFNGISQDHVAGLLGDRDGRGIGVARYDPRRDAGIHDAPGVGQKIGVRYNIFGRADLMVDEIRQRLRRRDPPCPAQSFDDDMPV